MTKNMPWATPGRDQRLELDRAIHADLATLRERITIDKAAHPQLRRGIVVAEAFMRLPVEADGGSMRSAVAPEDEATIVEALTQIVKLGRMQSRDPSLTFDMAAMLERIDAYRVMLIVTRHDANMAHRGVY
jgi:hypothetical protein